MSRHPIFRLLWMTSNFLILCSLIFLLYGVASEYATRRYLKGFSDALVPLLGTDEEKVEAILRWMREGPARLATPDPSAASRRDPENSLNFHSLLRVCGTATNAFLNLADAAGIRVRRLLLLDAQRSAKHVVAEVYVEGRWVVVDPLYRMMLRNATGALLTREDLRDPRMLAEATQSIPNYPGNYTYESTAHIRLYAIPVAGPWLRRGLDAFLPGWEEAFNWSLIVERSSFGMVAASTLALLLSGVLRFVLSWYATSRLHVERIRLRDRIARSFKMLFQSPS